MCFDIATAVQGLNLGMEGMKVGGLRLIAIPAKYAYGSKGRMPLIPPDAEIDMAVSLLSCKRAGTNPNSMLDPNAQTYVRDVNSDVAVPICACHVAFCSC